MKYVAKFFKVMLRGVLRPLSFAPAICMMYIIFQFSSATGVESAKASGDVCFKIVSEADTLLDLNLSYDKKINYAQKIEYPVRKLAHFSEYALLAATVALPLYVYGMRGIPLMLVAGAVCVGFACTDEYHQSFVSGRSPAKKDVMIDSAGAFCGIIVTRILGFIGRKTIFRPLSNEKKKSGKKDAVMAVIVIAGMLATTLEVSASSTTEKIEQTQGQIEETKGELEKVNSNIEELEGSKEELESTKKKFEAELNEIISDIEKLSQEIEQKQSEIEETQKALEAAKKKEEEQYQSMKVRIRYMYENGEENYMILLLTAEDMSDMMTRAEYISKITKYDRRMLDEFVATREEIQKEEILLQNQKQELERAKAESQEKQELMAQKVSKVKASISEYESQISEAEQRAMEFEERLRQQEESLESLERKKQQEEENARRAAANNITTNTSGIPLGSPPATVTSANNVQLLAAIIECEAGGESYEGKLQ